MSEVIIPQKIGKQLRCNCGYQWIYGGMREFFASCPSCRSTVTIKPKRQQSKKLNENGGAD
jgi:lipopolysaccharide biosynthesis regulator YciM